MCVEAVPGRVNVFEYQPSTIDAEPPHEPREGDAHVAFGAARVSVLLRRFQFKVMAAGDERFGAESVDVLVAAAEGGAPVASD